MVERDWSQPAPDNQEPQGEFQDAYDPIAGAAKAREYFNYIGRPELADSYYVNFRTQEVESGVTFWKHCGSIVEDALRSERSHPRGSAQQLEEYKALVAAVDIVQWIDPDAGGTN